MALYLGSNKELKVVLNNVIYNFNLNVVYHVALLTSDDYILTDLDEVCLITNDYTEEIEDDDEEVEDVINNALLSSDNYILTDSNEVYLITNDLLHID